MRQEHQNAWALWSKNPTTAFAFRKEFKGGKSFTTQLEFDGFGFTRRSPYSAAASLTYSNSRCAPERKGTLWISSVNTRRSGITRS
jgi:hypothetical protein